MILELLRAILWFESQHDVKASQLLVGDLSARANLDPSTVFPPRQISCDIVKNFKCFIGQCGLASIRSFLMVCA